MRKIFLAFGLMGLGAMSASFAACSSSSGDDTAAATDSGTDTSVVTDSGVHDSAIPTEAAACATCGQILSQGLAAAGSPCASTTPLLGAILHCACNLNPIDGTSGEGLCDVTPDGGDAGPDGGNSACADLCAAPTTTVPSAACGTCGADNCSTEVAACQADTGN